MSHGYEHLAEVVDHLPTAGRDGAAGRTTRTRMVRAGLQATSVLPVTLRFTSPTDAAAIAPYFNGDIMGMFVPAELLDRFSASVDRSADRGDFLFAFTMWITQERVPVE
ncbi:hypothetical protein ACFLIM_47405 [Nonomuraea sp. M3C6]|uniref:Uncharacterized protein n=1 Tax=Nonomuraea marmarensis TaxID=3351344 RepID=A0ABW7AXP6_9ACTN